MYYIFRGFPDSSVVKNVPATQETWVQFLGQEDPLENGMATRSSILAWRIPRIEEPGGLQSKGSSFLFFIGVDRGPGQATVYSVTQSQTQLK